MNSPNIPGFVDRDPIGPDDLGRMRPLPIHLIPEKPIAGSSLPNTAELTRDQLAMAGIQISWELGSDMPNPLAYAGSIGLKGLGTTKKDIQAVPLQEPEEHIR